jgi:hypothetical protein
MSTFCCFIREFDCFRIMLQCVLITFELVGLIAKVLKKKLENGYSLGGNPVEIIVSQSLINPHKDKKEVLTLSS